MSIEADEDDEFKEYVIERLLNKRVVKRGRSRKAITQYLFQWKNYGPEHDSWYNLEDLSDVIDLVKDYEEESRRIGSSTPML